MRELADGIEGDEKGGRSSARVRFWQFGRFGHPSFAGVPIGSHQAPRPIHSALDGELRTFKIGRVPFSCRRGDILESGMPLVAEKAQESDSVEAWASV